MVDGLRVGRIAMKWKTLWFVAVVLFSALVLSSNAAKPAKRINLWLTAEVEIAADGSVNAIRWLDQRPAAQTVTARLDPHIRGWKFEPGAIDGVPHITRTFLKTQVLAESSGSDVELRFGHVITGPHATHMVVPRYPEDAARAGISARVTAVLRVESDGKITFESLDYFRPRGRTTTREAFIEATRAALAQWKYTPERVSDHDVPVRVRVPVEFCAPDKDCTRLFAKAGNEASGIAEAGGLSGQAVALDSPVRLLTVVEGETI